MKLAFRGIFLLCVFFLLSADVFAAPVKALGDLNNRKAKRSLYTLSAQSGSKIFFTRTTADYGNELWVTDGTVAGTQLVKDITPGSTDTGIFALTPTTLSGNPGVYFIVASTTYGAEWWISDGTDAGTKLLKDINPGSASSLSSSFISPTILTLVGSSTALFAANDGTNGNELWITDGTESGTHMVSNLNAGSANSDPRDLTLAGIWVIFSATDGSSSHGRELFYTNGSAIALLQDIYPGVNSSNPRGLLVSNEHVGFIATNATYGLELWQTNYSTTTLVSDLTPGTSSSTLGALGYLSGINRMIYALYSPALPSPEYIGTLVSTDGTSVNTTTLGEISCIPGDLLTASSGTSIYKRMSKVVNGHLVFPCYSAIGSQGGLWVTDGSEPTTHPLLDTLNSGTNGLDFTLLQGDNRLIFSANDLSHGREPWTTDGTGVGTTLLGDFNPGSEGSLDASDAYLSLILPPSGVNASLLPLSVGKNRKMYYSDGTASNTRELFDDSAAGTSNSDPSEFFELGDRVLFAAQGAKGRELYITDGKKTGTKLLKDIFKTGDSSPYSFVRYKGKALFAATDGTHGTALWITNGTAKGTKLVKQITPGSTASSPILKVGTVRGKQLFSAFTESAGRELWVTNGKPAGTTLLKDIDPGISGSGVDNITTLGNKALFTANDGSNGNELWISDGTADGTTMLVNIDGASSSSSPTGLVVLGNKVIFSASRSAEGRELWSSDGTVAGTTLLVDINPGAGSSSPSLLTRSGNYVYFTASDGTHGAELWRTDGTAAGTIMVQDLVPGSGDPIIDDLEPFPAGKVLLSASTLSTGNEPYIAGPDPESITLLKDIVPGSSHSYPSDFAQVPGRRLAYFSAYSSEHGYELWKTNGTAAGTMLAKDIYPGTTNSSPQNIFAGKKAVYFSAATAANGVEPFAIKVN